MIKNYNGCLVYFPSGIAVFETSSRRYIISGDVIRRQIIGSPRERTAHLEYKAPDAKRVRRMLILMMQEIDKI